MRASSNPPPPPRGRPPGISAGRLMKRIVIAGAVHQKIKIAKVARDLGVSRSWASREAHDPETQDLLATLDKQDPETTAHTLRHVLKTIADAMIPVHGS